jgi:dTDP-4-amino-4,6-dideoxygalactose transaminase
MRVPFVDLRAQHAPIRQELDQAIQGVVDHADFICGEELERFEEEFAAFCGAAHAVGVDSGLSALELILRAYGIGPGDEVILPANTFIATATPVSFVGATPVLVDVDPLTYNIDVERIEAAITSRTRAIMPVHLYGLPAEMDTILQLADKHSLLVIEDACQAHGARYKGRRCGSMGHAAAFSFYPSKNLGGFGDGGMVVTNEADIAEQIRAMRNYGQKRKYRHEFAPYNHRLDTLQAAVLRVKLRYLDEWNEQRRRVAAMYGELLAGSGIGLPVESPNTTHIYHLYVIRAPERDALLARLQEREIGVGIHYPIPIHLQPFYASGGFRHGQLPVTESLCRDILSLPMFPSMTAQQVRYVAEQLLEFSFRPGVVREVQNAEV